MERINMDDFNSTNEKLADKERLTNKEILIKKIKEKLDNEDLASWRLRDIFLGHLDEYYDEEHAPWCLGKPKYENWVLVSGKDCSDYKDLNEYYDEDGKYHSVNCLTCFEEWCKSENKEMPELKNSMVVEIYRPSEINRGYKKYTGIVIDGKVYYQNTENKCDYAINSIKAIKPYIEKIWVLDLEHDFLINDKSLIWESYRQKKIKEVRQAMQKRELESLQEKLGKLK